MERLTVTVSLVLLASCAQPTGKSGAAARPPLSSFERTAETPVGDKNEQLVGRYQMFVVGARALKLDTMTGWTWILGADSTWKTMPDTPCGDASVESRIQTVVERSVEPLIANTKVYNPRTQQLDPISDAEKRGRVEAIVRRALANYNSLKREDYVNDPLGIRGYLERDKATKAPQEGRGPMK